MRSLVDTRPRISRRGSPITDDWAAMKGPGGRGGRHDAGQEKSEFEKSPIVSTSHFALPLPPFLTNQRPAIFRRLSPIAARHQSTTLHGSTLMALWVALCFEVAGELVECHGPSGCTWGVSRLGAGKAP